MRFSNTKSISEPIVCTNNSIIDLIEGEIEHETPFSDDEIDPMIDNYADDHYWNDAEWRKKLKNKLHKKMNEIKVWKISLVNELFAKTS